VTLDPSLPIEDADAKVYSGFVGYARTLDLWGLSGQIGLLVPAARADANGLIEGRARSVSRTGLGDPGLRLTANLYGAPALSPEEFAAYRQDTIVGVSLLVTAPWGRYDPDRFERVRAALLEPLVDVVVVELLGPHHARQRLAHHAGRVRVEH